MARLPLSSGIALCLAAALSCAAGGSAMGKPAHPQGAIDLKMESYDVDFKTGKTLMHNVAVSQGDFSITAQRAEATGLNFQNSHWVFSGDVHVNAEKRGNLSAGRAEVEFRDNNVAKATVTGNPAEFEQQREDTGQMARGRAGQIVYDVTAGTVQLEHDAWLSYGENEISNPVLVYNIRDQRVQASAAPGAKERIHIIVVPKAVAGPQDKEHGSSVQPQR